ncbi:hypothetical protein BMYO_0377 [Bifidobacterium myosotis]|uniref:Uncharacterized protein n=1 Tax=Bifidobacterium myosotis TaxID=1630166 RepID=A0A261FPR1_9BIFI|nr:hypothetical protein BMYO_0377 [Bifidobacterium myosotis]
MTLGVSVWGRTAARHRSTAPAAAVPAAVPDAAPAWPTVPSSIPAVLPEGGNTGNHRYRRCVVAGRRIAVTVGMGIPAALQVAWHAWHRAGLSPASSPAAVPLSPPVPVREVRAGRTAAGFGAGRSAGHREIPVVGRTDWTCWTYWTDWLAASWCPLAKSPSPPIVSRRDANANTGVVWLCPASPGVVSLVPFVSYSFSYSVVGHRCRAGFIRQSHAPPRHGW